MSKRVVIIGGVALGPKAANRLKRLDPAAEVIMIDERTNISFGGCGIPYYVSGEVNSLDALRSTNYGTVRTPEYFKERKDVTVLNRTRVLSIDRASRTIRIRDLRTDKESVLPYDRLVLGTGSTPKVPPVEGRDLQGVSGANSLEEAEAIRAACAAGKVNSAVVVGGGFIGMEMAVALAGHQDQRGGVHAAGHARCAFRESIRHGRQRPALQRGGRLRLRKGAAS